MSLALNSEEFSQLLAKIRVKLPIQNPLHSFVHNNILMMFEELDFHDGVAEAGKLYRAHSYWPRHKYIELYQSKKIIDQDIEEGIKHYLGHYHDLPFLNKMNISAEKFYRDLMFSDLHFNDDDIQPKIKNESLWQVCQEKLGGHSLTLSRSKTIWRAKNYWEKYYNDSYLFTSQPLIIRLISSYLDQGQSFWNNPFVKKGFWSFFCFDILEVKNFSVGWQKELIEKVQQYKEMSPEEIIQNELALMGIPKEVWEEYILDVLFDLKGWSGMVNKLEIEPWQATVKAPAIRLVDYIAALILIESSVDIHNAKTHSIDLSILYGRVDKIEMHSFQLSLALYQIVESFGLSVELIESKDAEELLRLINEIDEAETLHRTRLWHEAYENHFYREAITAIINHATHEETHKTPIKSLALFCIDDREESIRRHLEEVDPSIETYGVVGFFGIDMNFSSIQNQRLIAQCPPVVKASRIVREISTNENHGKRFQKFNDFLGSSDLYLYYHSRTLLRGFFSTLILGTLSVIPMAMQVFFPKQSQVLRKKIMNFFWPRPETQMDIISHADGQGYSYVEQAGIVATIIKMCAFKSPVSNLIVLVGHGSSSSNNPFKQAYGCGACGGNAGFPNSRAFAKMANDPKVREELKQFDIQLTNETFFVAGYHDTCTDEILFDENQVIPEKFKAEFVRVRKSLIKAMTLNAFERCQRFGSFDQSGTPKMALKHVKERALDLAQPRPEYGHSSNALAIVAKRDLTKGLYLNRRSFLVSYDWELDSDSSVLPGLILGAIPVAVNINLDYYFSCVDNDNYGCGSKLPLNLTSLIGVMTGSQSDLRIGLARQMIEIHEPIRNMTIVEAPLDRVRKVFMGHPRLKNILTHHWFRLVVKDPQDGQWYVFGETDFEVLQFAKAELKKYKSSMDLIKKTHLEEDFAEITHD